MILTDDNFVSIVSASQLAIALGLVILPIFGFEITKKFDSIPD